MMNTKCNILFLAASFKNWVCDTLYQEQLAISLRLPQSIFYGPGYRYQSNRVTEIISEVYGHSQPDAIFCYIDERRLLGEPLAEQICKQYNLPPQLHVFPQGLVDIKIPKFAWINDFWHCNKDEWDRILLGNGFDFVFSTYCPPFTNQQVFESFFSAKVRERIRFIPWPRAINPRVLPDLNHIEKHYDLSILGAMSPGFYPLRCRMLETFKQQNDLQVFHSQHPGYRYFGANEALMGEEYFKTLAQSRIFASCTGKYNIPFIKLYEVLACGSALLCDKPCGGELLGLENGHTYLEVNDRNFLTRARDYLNNPGVLATISAQGRQTYLDRHTTDIRAKEFALTVDALLHGDEVDTWMKYSRPVVTTKISPRINDQPALFRDESQVYLASADRWDLTQDNLTALKSFELANVDTYASVIGGFSGLNYLLALNPKKIVFFDVNTYMLDYAQLIVELITISSSPQDFIGRVFGRSVNEYLAITSFSSLNIDNQEGYLSLPVNESLVHETMSALSRASQETFQRTVIPHIHHKVPAGPQNCKRLLPCWPISERVPVGGGKEFGFDEHGQLVPNTNTFFYGQGWLKNNETFNSLKALLQTRPIKYLAFDLLNDDFAKIAPANENVTIHISNIDDWFPEPTKKRLLAQTQKVIANRGLWVWITSHNSIMVSQFDPHSHALLAIAPYIRGHVIEVAHKIPWGFHEFPRENVLFKDYLAKTFSGDTIILHILLGEGVEKGIVTKVLAKAYQECSRLIILEHERMSLDWAKKDTSRMTTKDELAQLITQTTGCQTQQMKFSYIRGERDSKRNMIFVIDK